MVYNAVYYIILLQDSNEILIAKIEPQEYENTDSEVSEKELYGIDKMSLGDSRKEWRKV